jgi:hypothetical protein
MRAEDAPTEARIRSELGMARAVPLCPGDCSSNAECLYFAGRNDVKQSG